MGVGDRREQETLVEPTFAYPSLSRRRTYLAAKRLFDFTVCLFVLPIAAAVIALCALAIRRDSFGPAIFKQQRIGRDGTPFTIYKLRTMFIDAPPYSYKVDMDDPRITRVGRWLRRSGLDELPQLWNVLRGDMALIGPRPELPFIVDQYQNGERRRLTIRPGITGWWQIHHRNQVPMHFNLEYDFYYLDNLSLGLDLRIAGRTLEILLAGLRPQHAARTEELKVFP